MPFSHTFSTSLSYINIPSHLSKETSLLAHVDYSTLDGPAKIFCYFFNVGLESHIPARDETEGISNLSCKTHIHHIQVVGPVGKSAVEEISTRT